MTSNWYEPDITLSYSTLEYPKINAAVYSLEQAKRLYEKQIYAVGEVEMTYDLFIYLMNTIKHLEEKQSELENKIAKLETKSEITTGEIWDRIINGQN